MILRKKTPWVTVMFIQDFTKDPSRETINRCMGVPIATHEDGVFSSPKKTDVKFDS